MCETKIDHGPGYRAYFVKHGDAWVLLLCGDDRKSQRTDIKTALSMVDGLKNWNALENHTMGFSRIPEDRGRHRGDLAAYFDEAPDDPAFLAHALGVAARARNMSQLARDTGLTREGLYKALSADGNPGFGTVLKVADAMGYRFALVGKAKQKATKRVRKATVATRKARVRAP